MRPLLAEFKGRLPKSLKKDMHTDQRVLVGIGLLSTECTCFLSTAGMSAEAELDTSPQTQSYRHPLRDELILISNSFDIPSRFKEVLETTSYSFWSYVSQVVTNILVFVHLVFEKRDIDVLNKVKFTFAVIVLSNDDLLVDVDILLDEKMLSYFSTVVGEFEPIIRWTISKYMTYTIKKV
ncbi:hypothetical protein RF11_01711 [Thelohanellus kitauei]|uniref:Uncharacterized protein n=1 Tax=Thelohanellus kitauei TaxID=669202 RepID=A0A0C2JSY7_THEKT|nr:hypothetical protein RF11_01711 [Thelohanellus kitauei]